VRITGTRRSKLISSLRLFPFWRSLRGGKAILIPADKAGPSAFCLLLDAGEFLSLKKHVGPSFVKPRKRLDPKRAAADARTSPGMAAGPLLSFL